MWADWYLPAAMPALERLFFSRVVPPASVLDVCCGSGHVSCELVRRGYAVTGIDSSAELIHIARERLPMARFVVSDLTDFQTDEKFAAALSTFDSLNHLLSLQALHAGFERVRNALAPGAHFVFDMNLEKAYFSDLRHWHVMQRDGQVGLVRGEYDAQSKIARTELMWFVRVGSDCWRRRESVVEQRCYDKSDIAAALTAAGFTSVECVSAEDAGVSAGLGFGRLFFSALA